MPRHRTYLARNLCLATLLLSCASAWSAQLNVEALIDGRSHLYIQGDSVWWYHYDAAPPGLHGGANQPTVLNGYPWYPDWQVNDPEESCRDTECASLPYSSLCPSLAQTTQVVQVQLNAPLDRPDISVEVVQQPAAGNGYTLIVEFDDLEPGGSEDYDVTLTYDSPDSVCQVAEPTPVPTLSAWAYLAAGGLLAIAGYLSLRRRAHT